jgi:hypothetical protein
MAISYTEARNYAGKITKDESSSNLSFLGTGINNSVRRRLAGYHYPFLEETNTDTTVANKRNYAKPANIGKLSTVKITVGSYTYTPKEAPSRMFFDKITETARTSNIPEWWYEYNGDVNFEPIPSSNGNIISFFGKKKLKDINAADYTTGTISLTNGSATVTGSGTTFTSEMVGRYLKSNNEGIWYKILSFTSATSITLDRTYQGATASNLSYTIAELIPLPDGFEDLPVYDAVSEYFMTQELDIQKAMYYKSRADELEIRMKREYGSKTDQVEINGIDYQIDNPNLYTSSIG